MHLVGPAALDAMPIPTDAIVSGDPQAAGTQLYTTPDGRTMVGLFTCTPGVFRFTLEAEEFTHLLSGHVIIRPDGGDVIDARPGDTYVLSAGQDLLIDVRETITDIYATWIDR